MESHDEDGDTTCASESDGEDDGSGKAWLKANLAKSSLSPSKVKVNYRAPARLPIPKWNSPVDKEEGILI